MLTPTERDLLESQARRWLKNVTRQQNTGDSQLPVEQPLDEISSELHGNFNSSIEAGSDTRAQLDILATFVRHELVPRLSRCNDELSNLLNALNGRFVPPGPAGAPTRGRVAVLPTGRNFFPIDPPPVPTQTSCHSGKPLPHPLLERHR